MFVVSFYHSSASAEVTMGSKKKRSFEHRGMSIMLDSGAYTARHQGMEIDLFEYMDYISRNSEHLSCYVVLDVIPDNPHKLASTNWAARQSFRNYNIMRKAGLDPMPVYHRGEPLYWLEKIIDTNPTRMGISAIAKSSNTGKREWLDGIFTRLCGKHGYTSEQIHAFGITSNDLMFRYPWRSMDSTAWRLRSGYGWILVPSKDSAGDYSYQKTPRMLGVSVTENGDRQNPEADHFNDLPGREQRYVLDWLEECGVTFEQVSVGTEAYLYRTIANATLFKRMAECYAFKPFRHRQQSLLMDGAIAPSNQPPDQFELMFVDSVNRLCNMVLNRVGVDTRLISYAELLRGRVTSLDTYAHTGHFKI